MRCLPPKSQHASSTHPPLPCRGSNIGLLLILFPHDVVLPGSNMIPNNVFRGRETPEQERALISDAVAVHMNTIRIWGGEQLNVPSSHL